MRHGRSPTCCEQSAHDSISTTIFIHDSPSRMYAQLEAPIHDSCSVPPDVDPSDGKAHGTSVRLVPGLDALLGSSHLRTDSSPFTLRIKILAPAVFFAGTQKLLGRHLTKVTAAVTIRLDAEIVQCLVQRSLSWKLGIHVVAGKRPVVALFEGFNIVLREVCWLGIVVCQAS